MLLFPCSEKIYACRSQQHRKLLADKVPLDHAGADVFFLKQHAEFGNACGTIAAVRHTSNRGLAVA